jgi:hypothetical protein
MREYNRMALNLQKFFGGRPGRREAEEWLRKAEE